MKKAISWYNRHAEELASQYEAVEPARLLAWLEELLPEPPALVLDVGSGTGRDAAWLSDQGYDVFAVEPSSAMRKVAAREHPGVPVRWICDALPSLDATFRAGVSFDLILVSAVWMHVPPAQRTRAFRKLVNLLKPSGFLAISIRIGPEDTSRGLCRVDRAEIPALARSHGAIVRKESKSPDLSGRSEIRWVNYAVQLPDDGSGAFPLLRHVILNDNKSSTYKLGLLRSVCVIADSSAGLSRRDGDERVSIPLGLVALTWLRLYRPLMAKNLPQNPQNVSWGKHLSFAKEGLKRLSSVSNLDLRVGMRFTGDTARALHLALRDAANTIRKMPAHYITYPNGEPILRVEWALRLQRPPSTLVIDEEYLRSFGEMLVPWRIWQAVQRFAVWIEPALVEEWIRLMDRYAVSQNRSLPRDQLAAAMVRLDRDQTRDVKLATDRAAPLLDAGRLYCVWSGRKLTNHTLDMDHCFPWSVWPCSDLWNLMPASRKVNQHEKRALLPSARLMNASQDRIMSWWKSAYGQSNEAIHERFVLEASSSLPVFQSSLANLDTLFDGALAQRARLRHDQQVPEWQGKKYL